VEVLSIATLGLQASAERFRAAANNIVNINTSNHQTKEVRTLSQVTGLEQANSISNPTTQTATRSDIDIASEFINLIQERLSYEANAKVINVADNLVGSLLDIKA
jgi:flagellar hook protein FlgE